MILGLVLLKNNGVCGCGVTRTAWESLYLAWLVSLMAGRRLFNFVNCIEYLLIYACHENKLFYYYMVFQGKSTSLATNISKERWQTFDHSSPTFMPVPKFLQSYILKLHKKGCNLGLRFIALSVVVLPALSAWNECLQLNEISRWQVKSSGAPVFVGDIYFSCSALISCFQTCFVVAGPQRGKCCRCLWSGKGREVFAIGRKKVICANRTATTTAS